MKKPGIYCDSGSEPERAVFAQMKMDLVREPQEADLIWVCEDYADFFDTLRPLQLLNHFPGEWAMVNKGELAARLRAFDRSRPRRFPALRTFFPETYRLHVKIERDAFLAQLPAEDTEENLWVLKPTDLADGEGVRVLWRFEELRRAAQALERGDAEPFAPFAHHVIQRYLKDVLLLEGRKSEIRLYWLIAGVDPLLVFLYREGTVRMSTLPFKLADYDNPLIHVTNVQRQKQHP
jgi:hypothetical protein